MSAAIGRPRSFDIDAALDAALGVFWRLGYEAASLEDLTAAMGISRSSFYACFGSKRDLFHASVQRYSESRLSGLAREIADLPDPARALARMMAVLSGAVLGRDGCYLVNCAVALGPADPDVSAIGTRHMAAVEAMVAGLIRRLRHEPTDETATMARSLVAAALGCGVLRKAGVPEAAVDAALAAARRAVA
jgi:TetR/AcrR family transcriptional repressor of nem operon